MALLDEVRALALEQVNFTNKDREALVEKQNGAYGELHRTTLEFEQAASDEDFDPRPGASALVRLAGQFGTAFPNLSEAQRDAIKQNIAEIYDTASDDVDTAGRALFNATVDFIQASQELNAFEQSQPQNV